MDRNKLKIVLGAATAFFLIVGIVLIVLGAALDLQTLERVILIAMAVVCIVLAGELGYFMYLMIDTKPNYFLYSSQNKRNISVQKLTFQTINVRMGKFLSGYAASEGKLWNDRVLDNPYLDMPSEFKPLVAYKMLYGLAEKDVEAGWNCLENSSEETIKFICDALSANGDTEFAQRVATVTARPMNIKAARDYLVKCKEYMRKRMHMYVVNNIDLF